MDYDDIVKGRRRNWDELKPEEIREKEKEEARARKKEEAKSKANSKKNYFEKREEMMDAARERDEARYRQTVRALAIGAAILAGIIVLSTVIGMITTSRRMAAYRSQATQYDTLVLTGERVRDFSDPVKAFASWRGAWIDRDVETIINTFSRQYLEVMQPGGNLDLLRERYRGLIASGSLEATREVALSFTEPELFRIPRSPWSRGQLALLRSQPFERASAPPGDAAVSRYIIAFSYDDEAREWRFADLREAIYFSVRWEFEPQIQALKGPTQATRYDESGRAIQR